MKHSIRLFVILLLLFALLHEICDSSSNFIRAYVVKGRSVHAHSTISADHKHASKPSASMDEEDDSAGAIKDDVCVHYCYPAYSLEFDFSIPLEREFLPRNEGSEHHRSNRIFHPPKRA